MSKPLLKLSKLSKTFISQPLITCSKLTTQTMEQGVNMFKVNNKDTRTMSPVSESLFFIQPALWHRWRRPGVSIGNFEIFHTFFYCFSIVDFEQVNVSWVTGQQVQKYLKIHFKLSMSESEVRVRRRSLIITHLLQTENWSFYRRLIVDYNGNFFLRKGKLVTPKHHKKNNKNNLKSYFKKHVLSIILGAICEKTILFDARRS